MGANSKTTYGADGSTSLLSFYPHKLTLVTDPAHPLYDERMKLPLSEPMILNMMAFGVLVPIIVTRDPDTGDVLVIDGRQRVRHALEANRRLAEQGRELLLVPATTRKGDNDATLMGMTVTTNELRQADPPLVRAAKMQRLKNLGQDDDAVALAFGVNKLTVQNTLALLDVSKPVQRAVESNLIGISDVKYLARLTPDQQFAKMEELVKSVVGKEGHARARAKREVIQADNPKAVAPKVKTRTQILAKHAEWMREPDTQGSAGYLRALEWVLGEVPGDTEKDTKTRDMVDELEQTPAA